MSRTTNEPRREAILTAQLAGAGATGSARALYLAHHELLDPTIAQFEGHSVTIRTDGSLAVFGTAADAIDCALALQTGMAARNAASPPAEQMALRVGVDLADLAPGQIETGAADGLVAGRLAALAVPGGVCASLGLLQRLKRQRKLELEDLGPLAAGRARPPERAFRVFAAVKTTPTGMARLGRQALKWLLQGGLLVLAVAAAYALIQSADR